MSKLGLGLHAFTKKRDVNGLSNKLCVGTTSSPNHFRYSSTTQNVITNYNPYTVICVVFRNEKYNESL